MKPYRRLRLGHPFRLRNPRSSLASPGAGCWADPMRLGQLGVIVQDDGGVEVDEEAAKDSVTLAIRVR